MSTIRFLFLSTTLLGALALGACGDDGTDPTDLSVDQSVARDLSGADLTPNADAGQKD